MPFTPPSLVIIELFGSLISSSPSFLTHSTSESIISLYLTLLLILTRPMSKNPLAKTEIKAVEKENTRRKNKIESNLIE